MVLLGVGHPLEGRGMAAGKPYCHGNRCTWRYWQKLAVLYGNTPTAIYSHHVLIIMGDLGNNTRLVPYGWARFSLVLDANATLSTQCRKVKGVFKEMFCSTHKLTVTGRSVLLHTHVVYS